MYINYNVNMTKVQDVIKYIPLYRNNTLILLRFTTL